MWVGVGGDSKATRRSAARDVRRIGPRLVLLGLGLLGLLLLAQGLQQSSTLRGSGPPLAGRAVVSGISAPVEISRDSFGVPHVRAAELRDAMRGLGFVHAQDRLWQMCVLRASATGRLAEIFGSGVLPQDRLARTLGFARSAARETEILEPETRALLEAYAEGINLWLDQLEAEPAWSPAELRWLELSPERWQIADTLAIVRMRAFLMSRSLGASLLLERLNRRLGGSGAQDFFPQQPPPPPPAPRVIGSLRELGGVVDAMASGLGLDGPVGSLGFVVGSSRSSSGKPLLANDPHVEFQAPPVFYFAHLRTPEVAVAGATWPGVPAFWMGHNRNVAWGQVALHAVVSDLFDETLRPSDPDFYQAFGRWTPLDLRTEEIRVRGQRTQTLLVRETRHGPLLGSVLPEDPTVAGYSLKWTGAAPESGVQSWLALLRARNWDEFRAAIRILPSPPVTMLYGDTRGNSGTQVAGRLPMRAVPPGLLSVPGEYDWSGFVPFEELPSNIGRKQAYRVVSTRGDGSAFAEPVEWLWASGGAADRLEARLRKRKRWSLEEVLGLQREQHSQRGIEAIERLLAGRKPQAESSRRVVELLRSWDGSTGAGSIGVSVYHVFRQRLLAQLLSERLRGQALPVEPLLGAGPVPGLQLARFLDRLEPVLADELVERALAETWTTLGIEVSANPKRWIWGEVHQLRLTHSLERLGRDPFGWAGRSLGRGPFPAPGDPDSVWTMLHLELPTKSVVLGPAARYAVDLADLDHALFGLAGGQSGHPGSVFYDDGLGDWLRGDARPLWMHRIDVAYHEAGRWELVPDQRSPELRTPEAPTPEP